MVCCNADIWLFSKELTLIGGKIHIHFNPLYSQVHQPYKLSTPYGKKYTGRAKTWQACIKDKKCKGFTRYGNKNFKKNKSAKKVLVRLKS